MSSPKIQSTLLDSKVTPADRILQLEKIQDGFTGYDAELRKDIRLVLVAEVPVAKTILSFTVGPQHTNRSANLHGSCTAAIFQIGALSALAVVARKGYWSNLGAGRSLRVTYLKPVEKGDGCCVTSEVVCAGKRMCKYHPMRKL
jgi:acyl-coenzyme A thioesterase PaaI-like protein